MKRPGAGPGGDGPQVPAKGDLFSGNAEVWDQMTADAYEGGGERKRATLLILFDGPMVKLWLNARGERRALWSAGESVESALAAMDEAIATGTASWRAEEPPKRR